MTTDHDFDDYYYRERYGGHRNGRSRSCSPRRKEHRDEHRCNDSAKYRYVDADDNRHRDKEERISSVSGYSRRTRWDVGDPERGRKQNRVKSRSRSRSDSRLRRRSLHDDSRKEEHRERKDGASLRRFSSRSSSEESKSSSVSSHRRSRSPHRRKSKHRSSHRRRGRSSSSSSSSSSPSPSRSRSKDRRHKKSKDKDKKKRKEKSKKRKRNRSRSRSHERRSILTGKKIKMKVHKTVEDHLRDANRQELLQFLNNAFE